MSRWKTSHKYLRPFPISLAFQSTGSQGCRTKLDEPVAYINLVGGMGGGNCTQVACGAVPGRDLTQASAPNGNGWVPSARLSKVIVASADDKCVLRVS